MDRSITMMPSGPVYLVSGITDMRKSNEGLSVVVADVLEMDAFYEAGFIFCEQQLSWLLYGLSLDNLRAHQVMKIVTY